MNKKRKGRNHTHCSLYTLKDDCESLVDELSNQFTEEEVTLNCSVDHIEKKADHYNVFLDNGTVYQADSIVVTTPHDTYHKIFSHYRYFDHFKELPQSSVAYLSLAIN